MIRCYELINFKCYTLFFSFSFFNNKSFKYKSLFFGKQAAVESDAKSLQDWQADDQSQFQTEVTLLSMDQWSQILQLVEHTPHDFDDSKRSSFLAILSRERIQRSHRGHISSSSRGQAPQQRSLVNTDIKLKVTHC